MIDNMSITEIWKKDLGEKITYMGEEWKIRNYFIFPLNVKSFCLQNDEKTLWLMCAKDGEVIRTVVTPRKYDPDAPIISGSKTFMESYKEWVERKREEMVT